MRILGFSTEHDSGIAFVQDGRIVYAANEERFTREKYSMAVPHGAFRAGEAAYADFLKSVDAIAVSSNVHIPEGIAIWSNETSLIQRLARILTVVHLDRILFGTLWGTKFVMTVLRFLQPTRTSDIKKTLASWGVNPNLPLTYIDHHHGHAASAYLTGPWERALVVTLDSQGDGVCSRVYLGEGGRLRELHAIPFLHSPGHYYLYVTLLMGFKLGREGKVTGLAARGDAAKTLPIFQSRITFDAKHLTFVNKGFYRLQEMAYLKKALAPFSREDVAAGIQRHLEDLVTAYIAGLVRRYTAGGPIPVVLAGGVFANVKLNQRIAELSEVSGIYIHPHMGDGGLAAGAALATEAAAHPVRPEGLPHAYLGPVYGMDAIEKTVKAAGLPFVRSKDAAGEVAKHLANGKVVAVYRGRMEYGPRALGNRSILYQATDPTVNDWLNVHLKRSEFMPFAPILRAAHVGDYFARWEPCAKALEFMTVTLDATDRCKKEAPAIVHVDGTARPQLVLKETNPFIDEVLQRYEALTKLRVLINTSFNMHEEPIVCTPEDAVRAFLQGHLDVIALEDVIIEQPKTS